MASITYWNRLEPRPRAPSLTDTLAACVRDPIWFLTRQWQFGEFHGADAGSPAFIQLQATSAPITALRVGETLQPVDGSVPLEYLIEREPLAPGDLTLQVELWQTFDRLLASLPHLAAGVVDAIRGALFATPRYTLVMPPDGDPDTSRFLLVSGRRALNGVALYGDARSTPPVVPGDVALPDAAAREGLLTAFALLADWVRRTFGAIGGDDPAAWHPDRLGYRATVTSTDAQGTPIELTVHVDADAGLDWYAFDLRAPAESGAGVGGAGGDAGAAPVGSIRRSVFPGAVRFRGMPNARWWDFESGVADFGAITPDRHDLAKLVIIDFMLVQGNDWFMIPYVQPVGTLARIDAVIVRDVFGGATLVERADKGAAPRVGVWTLFCTALENNSDTVGDFLLLPPTAGSGVQTSAPIEDVRFFRDELANLAWGVEVTIQNALGRATAGYERNLLTARAQTPSPGAPATLRYLLQTEVLHHWIPFVPVTLDPVRGTVALERTALLDTSVDPAQPILPLGRVLQPTLSANAAYRLPEEEVSRSGVRVTRAYFRTRWTDGGTLLWIARERRGSAAPEESGLRFDIAERRA